MTDTPSGSFDDFARREHSRLVGALRLYTADHEVAEEMANEALIRTLQRWDQVSGMGNPSAWLFRVALNLSRSHFRRVSAERRAIGRLAGIANEVSTDDDIALVLTVRLAVASLPRRQAQVVVCRYFLDMDVQETADCLGLTAGSVRVTASRALARLRYALRAETAELPRHG